MSTNDQMMKQMSMCKQRTMSGHRRIEYEVDDIGLIIEEWNLNSTTKMDDHHTNDEEEIGKYSVYINGNLVRQIELNTGKVIVCQEKYEPYHFLKYGPENELCKSCIVKTDNDDDEDDNCDDDHNKK